MSHVGSSSRCKHRAVVKDGKKDRHYRCHLKAGHEKRPGEPVMHQAPAGIDTLQWKATEEATS